jgi:hypothetical protein
MKFWSILLAALSIGTLATAQEAEQEDSTEQHSCCMGKDYRHTIYMAPIQISEQGLGFSIGYEAKIGNSDLITWTLPLIATFNPDNSGLDNSVSYRQDPMFYVMPGIRVYPTGSKGIVKSAIGPSLIAGWGQQTEYNYYMPYGPTYYPNSAVGTTVTKDKFVFGAMLNYSLIITPTAHLCLGLDLGLGFSYLNMLDNVHTGTSTLFQSGFKLGYKL